MRAFWPPGEAAQADYEQLRSAVLQGQPLISLAAARFEHRGLCGLILKPAPPRRSFRHGCGAHPAHLGLPMAIPAWPPCATATNSS